MNMRSWMARLEPHAGLIVLFALLIVLWQALQAAASFEPDAAYAERRAADAIRQASREILHPGDRVFLSSQNSPVRQALQELRANVYLIDPPDANGVETPLLQVLDDYCQRDEAQEEQAAYWIWTMDNPRTLMLLGQAARALNFFFGFQAVLPYRGSEAFAIDKLLRLQPKDDIISSYCEAGRVAATGPVLVVLDADRFSPWIGSMATGRITWLASGPEREMAASDFAVQDMPPLLTYDVYWMGQVPLFPSWVFTNQDMAAYDRTAQMSKVQAGVVLVDRKAELGITALRYLRECRLEEASLESSLFRQMCFK